MTAKIKSALECAAGILLRRQHTVSELTNKLRKKGVYAKSQIDEAIAELERHSFLNDERFAADFTEAMKNRSWGAIKIKNKLREKGVSREIIEQTLSETTSPEDETERAVKALEKKLKSLMTEKDTLKRRAKALRHLASKGFSANAAYKALNKVMNRNSNDDTPEEKDNWI